MPAHTENTVVVVANTAGELFPENGSRAGAFIQNFIDSPVYISNTNPPVMGPPSVMIPAGSSVDTRTGELDFGTLKPTQAHYYKSAGSGSLSVWEWNS